MKQTKAEVISNEQILPAFPYPHGRNTLGSQITRLSCPEIAWEARPGQFVMIRCGEDCMLPRPFSIHQVNDDSITLFFTAWEDGKGTRWLSQQKNGATLNIFGPLGNGYTIYPGSKNLLLVAGGIGIAPICFLAQQAVSQGHSVRLLLGAQTKSQLYPARRIPSGVESVVTTDDGTITKMGRVTVLLSEFAKQADQVFACGPVGMYKTMAQMPELKDKPVQISLEIMMGCGAGVCYGCTIRTKSCLKQVCKDGPVFDLSDLDNINWNELIL